MNCGLARNCAACFVKGRSTMRTVGLALLVLLATAEGADPDPTKTMPHHPYRKVGDRYYDLRPIYDWLRLENKAGHIPIGQLKPEDTQIGRRPMPEWIGANDYWSENKSYRVQMVLRGGLIVEQNSRNTTEYGNPIFLTNYPHKKEVTDRQGIKFLALRTGVYHHRTETIPFYDYGIPYDPAKLLAERNRTNAVKPPTVAVTNSTSNTNRTKR